MRATQLGSLGGPRTQLSGPRRSSPQPGVASRLLPHRRVVCEAAPNKEKEDPVKAPPTAPAPPASNKGKKGSGVQLTEVDMMALRSRQRHKEATLPQKRGFFSIAWDQVADSVDDVARHWKRAVQELPTSRAFDKLVFGGDGGALRLESDKPVVLLLGSGWGAHSIMKVIDTDTYQVVCVSPRNYFLFTPMLPSTAVGTVEFRSLLEPVRVANPFVDYFEANCDRIDLDSKVAYCTSRSATTSGRRPQFEVPYDILVVGVGEMPATFGTPGVLENCFFMKEIPDSVELRQQIANQFELATLPGTTREEVEQLLHFVVVGGGPTGVEFAGTMSDFLKDDLKRKYPELMPYVRVSLFNSQQSILTQFDAKMQQNAIENFKRVGVEVRTGVRVTEVTKDTITLKDGEKIKYGVCVWSAGNAPRPLVQDLVQQIPEQAEFQPGGKPSKLAVDPFMRVIGARDVMAIGDCTLLAGDRLPTTAQVAGQQGAYVAHMVNRGYMPLVGGLDQPPPCKPLDANALVGDSAYATLGGTMDDGPPLIYYKKPFEFLNLGMLAYLGDDRALTQIEVPGANIKLSGQFAFLVWKSVYITKQVSFRNRVLILFDWIKVQVFGRDLSNY